MCEFVSGGLETRNKQLVRLGTSLKLINRTFNTYSVKIAQMLFRERMLGTSSFIVKLAALTVRDKVRKAKREPGSVTNSFVVKDYSRLLGLDPEESEKI